MLPALLSGCFTLLLAHSPMTGLARLWLVCSSYAAECADRLSQRSRKAMKVRQKSVIARDHKEERYDVNVILLVSSDSIGQHVSTHHKT